MNQSKTGIIIKQNITFFLESKISQKWRWVDNLNLNLYLSPDSLSPACTARLRCRPSSAVWPVVCSPPVFWSLLAGCQAPGLCQVALLLAPHHLFHSINQNKLLFNTGALLKNMMNSIYCKVVIYAWEN